MRQISQVCFLRSRIFVIATVSLATCQEMSQPGHLSETDIPDALNECMELGRWLTEEATAFEDQGKGIEKCLETSFAAKAKPLLKKLVRLPCCYHKSFTDSSGTGSKRNPQFPYIPSLSSDPLPKFPLSS